MIHRSTLLDVARRVYNTLVRGGIHQVDDSTKVQNMTVRLLNGEMIQKIERIQHYGFTSVPQKPGGGIAEAIVGFIGGARSLPAAIATEDRRSRPLNYKAGESSHYDDQGQYSKVARDGHHRVAKQHTLTAAGSDVAPKGVTQPDTVFELNEQLKGLSARVEQAEHNIHGLHYVTSQFRQIVQEVIPAVAAVAPILNMDPSGLKPMADQVSGIEPAYLQQQIEQALGKFLTPNIGGVTSVLTAGLEASINTLQTQIDGIATSNPVVGQVDALTQELSDLQASGADQSVVTAGAAVINQQITALTSNNPIVSQIAGLRATLQGLVAQAGPGLNFLAPQQRLAEKLSRSLRLTKS